MSGVRALVTGSAGFIGRNLVAHLRESCEFDVVHFNRLDPPELLVSLIAEVDMVIHLAGENRPADPSQFSSANVALTEKVCTAIRCAERNIPLLFTSSIHAIQEGPYGQSKYAAEQVIEKFSLETGNTVLIYRLPGIFGKWCRPNYNSVVATFCYNVVNDIPLHIKDPDYEIKLNYIDDLVEDMLNALSENHVGLVWRSVRPEYSISIGKLASQIQAFRDSRATLAFGRVGKGLIRALYSTYVSYLPPAKFSYELPMYADNRGIFVEMLKTEDAGQISFFTALPGVTRGGHYHHTKTEKFLVLKGTARFRFRSLFTGECAELLTSGHKAEVVDTVPGWSHDVTNVGDEELVCMLWANEVFNPSLPDTYPHEI